MVNEVVPSKDGIIRKMILRYRNHQQNVDRYTTRSVRGLVLIHPIDELNLMEELGKVASIANRKYKGLNISNSSFWECQVNNFTCVKLGTHSAFVL